MKRASFIEKVIYAGLCILGFASCKRTIFTPEPDVYGPVPVFAVEDTLEQADPVEEAPVEEEKLPDSLNSQNE